MMKVFKELMKKSYDFNEVNYDNDWKWQLLSELYDKNFIDTKDRNYNILPKKIHQIWLGSELPEQYKKWADTWKQFNPDWEYKLWTDDNLDEVDIENREQFNTITNMGQKSDYLRYHILNQFGGIYADTDMQCCKSFDTLSYVNFLIGVGYLSKVELYTNIIGCTAGHPIMSQAVKTMNLDRIVKKGWQGIFETTGGYFFTDVFFSIVKTYIKDVLVFPPDYFCPFPNQGDYYLNRAEDFIQEHSYALHHWACSWIPNLKEKRYGIHTRK